MMRLVPVLTVTALVLQVVSLATGPQPVRDNFRPANVGTATIRGTIVSADDERRPLRRARVTLAGIELEISKTIITEDDGSFSFEQLPAGRYSLRGSKDGYVTMSAGARRPGRPGTSIEVRAGQTAPVAMTLPLGSVITGTILNPEGEPATGVMVTAMTYRYITAEGQRRLGQGPPDRVTTDDRGVYRIFGLAPGDYVVAALPRMGATDLRLISEAEIRAALAEVRSTTTSSRPGFPVREPPRTATTAEPPTSVALTPVFYPGTTIPGRAATVRLGTGEVRTGVDFDLQYVPATRVEGVVIAPPGVDRVQVTLVNADRSAMTETRDATVGSEGQFVFRSLAPGDYVISARVIGGRAGTGSSQTTYWGMTHISVGGDDIAGVTIPIRAGLTISGHLVFDGARTPDPGSLRLPLEAANTDSGMRLMLPNVVLEGHRFSMTGIVPGRYQFLSPPRGIRTPVGSWWLTSIAAGARELLDAELDLRESSDSLVVTFSERASELSGSVRSAGGLPVTDEYVVIFPRDERMWFHQSRRIAGVRPDRSGHYVVRNLPAGEYFVAVSAEIEQNEWYDPAVLRALMSQATVVRLETDDVRTLNLSLPR